MALTGLFVFAGDREDEGDLYPLCSDSFDRPY